MFSVKPHMLAAVPSSGSIPPWLTGPRLLSPAFFPLAIFIDATCIARV